MVTLEIGTVEFETKEDIIYTLEEIARNIDMGYTSGMTNSGVWYAVEGDEEFIDEDFEEEDND